MKTTPLKETLILLVVIIFFATFGGFIGYYYSLYKISDRAVTVAKEKKECYTLQDIQAVIFGEPQL